MNQNIPANPELLAEFICWWDQNKIRNWSCIWRRRSVWLGQLMQKLGWHQEIDVPLFWGEKMRVITGETISQQILAFGYSEVALTTLMLWLVKSGQTVVDIGTHFGYEAMLASKLVGSTGHVFCFEPNPDAYFLAQKNLARFPHALLAKEAVADKPGTFSMQNRPIWESAFNRCALDTNEANTTIVPVTTLDITLENYEKPVDFIKCDVEGLEILVMKGAHNLLLKDSPILVLEADMPSQMGQASARTHKLSSHLQKYDYQAFNFDFDGSFKFGLLDSFPVHHANIVFIPNKRQDLLGKLKSNNNFCYEYK